KHKMTERTSQLYRVRTAGPRDETQLGNFTTGPARTAGSVGESRQGDRDLLGDALEPAQVVDHSLDVSARLPERRHTLVAVDIRRSRVISGDDTLQRVAVFAIPVDEYPQIAGSRIDILLRNGGISPEFLGGLRHELHQADGSGGGYRFGVVVRLCFHDAAHEC